jgi:hypothetical protein
MRSDHVIHETLDVGFIGDISRHRNATFHLHGRRIAVDRDDLGAYLRERWNNRLSQCSGASGDQHDFAIQSHRFLHRG